MPTISIHIVTYNSAATLDACLRAALAQTGVDFIVHVWDNASSDESVKIARRHGVLVTASETNLGYAAAHNRMIDGNDATYVLTLNPDALLLPGFLSAMVTALDNDPQIGSASGCLLRVEILDGEPVCIDGTGLIMRRNRRQGLADEGRPISERPTEIREIFGVDGACAFYRRAMLESIRVQGEIFDEDFFMHKEDVDVAWRSRLLGWSSVTVPDAVAHHVRSFRPGQRKRVSPYMRFLGTRNRYLLMLKNEIPVGFWLHLPFIAVYDTAIFVYLLLRERESLSALKSAWELRKKMLIKRHVIQARRQVKWRDLRRWFEAG